MYRQITVQISDSQKTQVTWNVGRNTAKRCADIAADRQLFQQTGFYSNRSVAIPEIKYNGE